MSGLINYFYGTSTLSWLALFPLTYLAHIAEEYWGGEGYSTYLFKNYGIELSAPRFLVLQGVGLSLMLAGILLAASLRFPYTMLAILAAIVLSNGLVHAMRSIVSALYGPGLVTAIAVWIPLGYATLVSLWGRMNAGRFLLCAAIGVAISFVVEVIAMRGGKLPGGRSSRQEQER
jgi:hypothetical protein